MIIINDHMLKTNFQKYTLHFRFDAGTSRGILKEKDTWLIKVWEEDNPEVYGLGEAGPLKKLSIDDIPDFEEKLATTLRQFDRKARPSSMEEILELVEDQVPTNLPSIAFGLETALLDLINGGKRMIFDNDFFKNQDPIPINGLIWMGHTESMLLQISDKIAANFDCIKLKIGSLDFDRECDILDFVRRKYYQQDLILRVDANGAFTTADVERKLDRLSAFNLHSIEQPILPGQIDLMKKLCATTPVPIALDEELIGIEGYDEKVQLLSTIRPQYIILKPTLIGGLRSSQEWIRIAEEQSIGWWLTSALESNVGLNAISQFARESRAEGHQGLGTGQLYTNNIGSPLEVAEGFITYKSDKSWDLTTLTL